MTIPTPIRTDLTQRWNEPHRKHHNQRHLDEVLAALETLRGAGLEFAERPVVLAAWFHDAIYDPAGSDNEGDSAELARSLLAEDPDRDEVARLVEMTRDHRPADDDANGIALADADFSVLGADPARYDEYAAGVRAEYRHVPDLIFRSTRRGILAEFLTRDHLYASAQAQRLWEEQARANLRREVRSLVRPAG
ncbi:hypothetical protein [Gordonia phthalatica]|uniref:Metal-dependent phosphohydrolase n=1 Tax=Gordonia phthalatica TaxID=1136941 RepID=A0A0N9N8S2_9ACTN|nr:hypothetical protein [Gordonia phthalatica]ALG83357.1 hypothetical protein ACH46_01065 [Gordonia phthalatica]